MIVVRDLIKHYDDGLVKALNGISFEVARGEVVSLMGPSGCGKSTLLNLLGTLDTPTSGEILIDGKSMSTYRPLHRFRARTVGFIFQFHHLIPGLSLLENAELPMYSTGISRRAMREKATQTLVKMGLADRMDFLPTKVSGGERQRAAIARALVNDPSIILADEPTGSVDTETGKAILDYLIHLCDTQGVTMLIATHNRDIAADTHRILQMRDGVLCGATPTGGGQAP
jgi:putative ABC transport system ATP-binding protein